MLAVIALICTFTISAQAQGRYRGGNGYDNGYNNNGYNNNGYNNGYNNGGHCGNGNAYNNNCNNEYGGNGYGNGYGRRARRGYYRPRPVTYCQPVVIAPRPRYCPPPRYAYGRPRININIGF